MKRLVSLCTAFGISSLAACSSTPKPEPAPAPVSARPAPTTPAPVMSPAAPSGGPGFHGSRLVALTDRYEAVANGQVLGTATVALSREGANYRHVVDFGMPAMGMTQHLESLFDATTFMPISQVMTASMQGMSMNSKVTVAGGRAKGTAQDPGPTGLATSTVDLAVPPGTLDDQGSTWLLTTLDLADGFTTSFKTLAAGPYEIRTNTVTVQGKETVSVPAGTFETYRILVHSKNDDLVFITTAQPRKIVLLRVQNGALDLRLLK